MRNSDIILSVENVSKEYQLGTFSAGTFGGDLKRWTYKIRGKEDPLKRVGTNDRTIKNDIEFVLALQDINFEVKKGEVLGIIGRNGAGKSTLLKLLSRVTTPSTGVIRCGGRMASLLEVGTGFHPELTGMENIFLNGAILGMTKFEIKRKLDDIIDFSGCAQFIDTPVKRYSSGMRVRLGFAVAAFLDPEILVVDEVLAVGDAEFQKQAIGKMQEVSKGDGRTVLFVSHNMASVASLCTSGLVLKNGTVDFTGSTDESIAHYLKNSGRDSLTNSWISKEGYRIQSEQFELNSMILHAKEKTVKEPISMSDTICITIEFENKSSHQVLPIIQLKDGRGGFLFVSGSASSLSSVLDKNGKYLVECQIPENLLNEGEFFINLAFSDGKKLLHLEEDILGFVINPDGRGFGKWMGRTKGPLKPSLNWTIKE